MASAAVESSFDVAYWFIDRALNDNEYIQPQKLHRLMFLAQAYFAVAYHGRLLMPGLFVADDFGPIEPNVFRACAIQRPPIEPAPIPEIALQFLDSIWRRFGSHTTEALNRQVNGHPPYVEAIAKGPRSEITVKAMVNFYGNRAATDPALGTAVGAPPISQVLRSKTMVSQSGKPVSVVKWIPKIKQPEKR